MHSNNNRKRTIQEDNGGDRNRGPGNSYRNVRQFPRRADGNENGRDADRLRPNRDKAESGRRSYVEEELSIQVEKPLIPEVQLKPEVVQRNRRLFAGIMTHLDTAKKRLAADSATIDQRKQVLLSASLKNESKSKEIAEKLRSKRASELKKVTSWR